MNRDEFRQHMNNYKKARESNPSLSYWDFLEKLSEAKSKEWNEDQDLVFIQMANDNIYNYRQMYEDNPNYNIEKGHFTDKYKTVYHPTFSNESIYSDEKSEYNPKGSIGGSWEYENKQFILGPDQNLDYSQQYLDIADPGWKAVRKYADGTDGIVDELKSNSRTILTPEEQSYLLNKSRQRQRMSGAIIPMFDIQDAADLTPIGDVLTARDTYNAFKDQDYIKASAMLGLMLAPPALGKIAKEKIPSFVTAAADKINELRRRERRQKELDTKIFSQGIEDRNRIIEELYDTPGIWDRAYNADITYGTNYVDTYDNLINNYYSNYFNLPEPVRKDIGDAQAMMSAKPEAIRRYNDEGIPASWSDFAYYINPSIENLDKALTRHEMGHYVDFNMSKSNNADRGNFMFNELRKDLSVDLNPLMPNKTDYFRQGTEQKSYMNTLRQFMFDNNMINKIDDQVTQKQIKEAIDKLPSELKSVKAAYKQFKSPRKYTKWFNTIPLLGTIPFIYNYSQEKDSN